MKIVLFILFVFSTTNLLGYISNGGDIIFAVLLHRIKNIDSPKEYLGKEINLLQLQESLSKFDVPSKISTSGINSLKDNVWIVFELKPVLSNSEPELGLIECSDSGKFYIYDIFMYKRHLIDINAVNELFKYTTGRYLCVGKCIASNKVVIRHFPDITHKKKKNIVCNTGSFIDYSIGEHIKIPKSVDLGLVASGGLKIPVKIPIESIDNVKVDIISIQVPCGCISEIKKPNKISTNSKSNIEFMLDPSYYNKTGLVDTYIIVNTSDRKLQSHLIKITGLIDDSATVYIEPYRIYDNEYLPKTVYEFDIFTECETNQITDINIISIPDIFDYTILETRTKLGKLMAKVHIVFVLKDNIDYDKCYEGAINLSFMSNKLLRTFSIPITMHPKIK